MSYFSRIAKQSGLRFSGQDGKRSGTGAPHPEAPPLSLAPLAQLASLASLEREETLMIDPTTRGDKEETISGLQKQKFENVSELTTSNETAGRREKIIAKGAEVSGQQEVSGGRETSGKGGKKEVFSGEPEQNLRNVKAGKSETGKSPDAGIEKMVPAKKDVPQIATRETGREILAQETGAQEIFGQPERPAKEIIRGNAGEPAVEKRFFVKTAGAIEQGNRDPAEIQNILLREVQEWAAAIPVEAEDAEAAGSNLAGEQAGVSEVVVKRNISQAEREPGVIAIGEERAGETKKENRMYGSEDGRIEEQSFELSIGTINVVIEGDEKPQLQSAQPAADARGGEKNTQQGAGGRSSRLSRSYL